MLKGLYVAFALLIVGGYAFANYTGMDFHKTKKGIAQKGVRGAHGGARTFFYGGYRGGK